MKRITAIVKMLFIGAALLMARCSLGPLAAGGGGTNTGNPGFTAASAAAFTELDSIERCDVTHYLRRGVATLDPAGVDTSFAQSVAVSHLAKTLAVGSDTVVRVDTTFVLDTLARTVQRNDTIITVIGLDSSVLITQKTVVESIVVKDTVLVIDTSVVFNTAKDTAFATKDSLSSNAPDSITIANYTTLRADAIMSANSVNWNVVAQPSFIRVAFYQDISNRMLLDSLAPTTVSFNGVSVRSDSQVQYNFTDTSGGQKRSISLPVDGGYKVYALQKRSSLIAWRSVAPDGSRITESYSDEDGDGFLETAPASVSPSIIYTASAKNGPAQSSLTCIFDAGADMLFKTRESNRILSFAKSDIAPGCSSAIRYRVNAAADSAVLGIAAAQLSIADSVQSCSTTVALFGGIDHASQAIGAIHKTILYRSGLFTRIDLVITPQIRTMLGRAAPACDLRASIYFADGSIGKIDNAIIDPKTGTLSGTFIINREIRSMTINRDGTLR
ncbi:MAG: hypothetical protein PHC61_13385 [Chitinivibrionales bacterium]|nr:hypothetical protein [Chitinivibrionales bacterium]